MRKLKREEFELVRRGIIRCILATDISKQSGLLKEVSDLKFSWDNEQHREMVSLGRRSEYSMFKLTLLLCSFFRCWSRHLISTRR